MTHNRDRLHPSARDLRKAISAMLNGKGCSDAPEAVDRVADWLRDYERDWNIAERYARDSD